MVLATHVHAGMFVRADEEDVRAAVLSGSFALISCGSGRDHDASELAAAQIVDVHCIREFPVAGHSFGDQSHSIRKFTRVAAGTSEALRAIGRLAAQRRAAASLPKRSCRPPSLCAYYLRNEYCLCAELQGPVQQRNCDLVEESHQYENLVDRDSRICINLPHVWPDHR